MSIVRVVSLALGDPFRGTMYVLAKSNSVPSARTVHFIACSRPATTSRTSVICTCAALYQTITPAYASSFVAGDSSSFHPSYSPVVSSALNCSRILFSDFIRCVSWMAMTSLPAASVFIVRYSLPSACHTSAGVSSASSFSASRRCLLVEMAARSLVLTPPWLSVTIRITVGPFFHLCFASSIASLIFFSPASCSSSVLWGIGVVSSSLMCAIIGPRLQSPPSLYAFCAVRTSISFSST